VRLPGSPSRRWNSRSGCRRSCSLSPTACRCSYGTAFRSVGTVQHGHCRIGRPARNGAGKATAIKLLGLLRPTAGSSSVLGCDSQALTPRVRQRIGYVTEGHHLYRWMTIGRIEKFQKAFFPGEWNARLFDDMGAGLTGPRPGVRPGAADDGRSDPRPGYGRQEAVSAAPYAA